MALQEHLFRLWVTRIVRFYSTGSASSGKASNDYASHLHFSSTANHYQVLGISVNCSQKDVRNAFIERSKQYHPDACQRTHLTSDELKNKFQQINEAYHVLYNPDARRQYDISLRYNSSNSRYSDRMASTRQYRPTYQTDRHYQYRNYDFQAKHPGYENQTYYEGARKMASFRAKLFLFAMTMFLVVECLNIVYTMQSMAEKNPMRYRRKDFDEREYDLMMRQYFATRKNSKDSLD